MTTTMSIRELMRNGNMVGEYDYIDIEDRKRKAYKGVFVSRKYADEVKAFLQRKIAEEKRKKIDSLMHFAGSMEGESGEMTAQEIRASKRKEYEDA
ncbi:hypothetical protein [Nitratifractor sp.]|uniref:hypothetical protein n=1 Tax=Nitratifractor sp. TaxID=2268144 RepID=UPI0025D097D9|nr:hypothetical protein [Nitratifractor sp.]